MSLDDLNEVLPRLVDEGLPGGGEFLVANLEGDEHTAGLIALLIWHGFLPMGGNGMLLPKIHKERCVLPPSEVHIGRKVRRRAKGFRLTVDTAWPLVVDSIQRHTFTSHKGDCWLSDQLARCYESVNQLDPAVSRGAAFHSVELWHEASGHLVAGEIGYTCGAIYSSCTGFTLKDEYTGAGSVQMAALARWLERSGFQLWDLGMELDYKIELGGRMIPREEWAKRIRAARSLAVSLASPHDADADAVSLCSGAIAAEDQEPDPKPMAAEPAPRSDKKAKKAEKRAAKRAEKELEKPHEKDAVPNGMESVMEPVTA